jgi:hypothetical protein
MVKTLPGRCTYWVGDWVVPPRCLEILEKRIIGYRYRRSFLDLSQPALCWLKFCYDVYYHFSLTYMAIGWRLITSWVEKRGVRAIGAFVVKFGGHSLLLCFWVSLREVVFKLVGRPVGKTAASIPRGATQTPGCVKELKLVWFGDFKIQFGTCILAYRAACSASLL